MKLNFFFSNSKWRGDISGVGYSLETAGVDTADYRGREGENLFQSSAVQEADRTGWIRKIKFYVNDPGDETDDRTVLLHVYRDGHIRCEKHVEPIIADKIVSEISIINNYSAYLTPLNELLGKLVKTRYAGSPSFRAANYIRDVNGQFDDLIQANFDTTLMRDKETRLYISIFANIGISICENGLPGIDEIPEITESDRNALNIPNDSEIKDFFNQYVLRVHNISIDYPDFVDHFDYLLSEPWDPSKDSPLDIVKHVINTYDL